MFCSRVRFAKKIKSLFTWKNERKYNIIFLEETLHRGSWRHLEDTRQGRLISSHDTNHSCGVMVLVIKNGNSKAVEVDVQGRYVVIKADVHGSKFLFVNIYGPNKLGTRIIPAMSVKRISKSPTLFHRSTPTMHSAIVLHFNNIDKQKYGPSILGIKC